MISRNDVIDAVTRCVGYDPIHAPKDARIMVEAWSEHFSSFSQWSREDLFQAVTEYYKLPQRPWPQPADLSAVIRARKRDAADRAPIINDSSTATDAERETHMRTIREILKNQTAKWSVPQ